jgi:hypothetical protein
MASDDHMMASDVLLTSSNGGKKFRALRAVWRGDHLGTTGNAHGNIKQHHTALWGCTMQQLYMRIQGHPSHLGTFS